MACAVSAAVNRGAAARCPPGLPGELLHSWLEQHQAWAGKACLYHGEPSKACLDWLAHMFAGQRHYHDAGYRPQHHKAHGRQHQGKHMRLQLEAAWGRAAAAEAAAQKVVCGPLPPPVALKRHVCLLICCLSCLSAGEAAGAGGCQPAGGCALLPFQRPRVGGWMWVLIELPPRPLTVPACCCCLWCRPCY